VKVIKRPYDNKFAEKTGISPDTIGNLENNKYAPTPDTIDRICAAYDVTPFDLLLPEAGNEGAAVIDLINKKLKLCSVNQLNFINSVIDSTRRENL